MKFSTSPTPQMFERLCDHVCCSERWAQSSSFVGSIIHSLHISQSCRISFRLCEEFQQFNAPSNTAGRLGWKTKGYLSYCSEPSCLSQKTCCKWLDITCAVGGIHQSCHENAKKNSEAAVSEKLWRFHSSVHTPVLPLPKLKMAFQLPRHLLTDLRRINAWHGVSHQPLVF